MKVVFVDRDGVINQYPGDGLYVTERKTFKFIPGSIEGLRKLKQRGFKVFVISNQAGVAKGVYTQDALDSITKFMKDTLKKKGIELDGIYYCVHRREDNCDCRKPKTGLLREALSVLKAGKVETSVFVGDSFVDMQTAKNFGAKPILVLSGNEKIANRNTWEFQPDFIFDNLLIAAHYICEYYG